MSDNKTIPDDEFDFAQYENGQDLWEEDPQNPGEITPAAEAAQEARWKRLIANHPPTKLLARSNVPTDSNHPPLYRFGIPYTYDWMIAYAKHHNPKLELTPAQREVWGGREFIDMREVDFEAEGSIFTMLACHLTIKDIQKRCDFVFDTGRPFSLEYDGIISLWSNYDMRERSAAQIFKASRFQRVVAELMKAMSEGDAQPQEPMWWFDWDNGVGLTSLN